MSIVVRRLTRRVAIRRIRDPERQDDVHVAGLEHERDPSHFRGSLPTWPELVRLEPVRADADVDLQRGG